VDGYLPWIAGGAIQVTHAGILGMFRTHVNKGAGNIERRWPAATDRSGASAGLSLFPPRTSGAPLSARDQVLLFFLNLFKGQNDIDPGAPAQMVRVEERSTCPNETYEMRVLHQGEWVSRRLSIGLLGQGGGSRSKCYYVIYDTHLVIKIPTEPITDLKAYSQRVAAENAIVARLAPLPCIVPGVVLIAKSLSEFRNSRSWSDEKLEEKFFRLLKVTPEYQNYLKIGGSFVFFMDLSKYFFMSTILQEIHGDRHRLVDEALENPDLLWDHYGFAHRYGERAAGIRYDLLKAFTHCENRLRGLIDPIDPVDPVANGPKMPVYVFKQWFLRHLVGEKIDPRECALDAETIDRANRLLDQVLHEHRRAVDHYCSMLGNYLRDIRFSKNRRHMEGLAANTLVLLDWVHAKGLALRDLKPENLFVAGNPDEFPLFLTDTEKFSIGLIDVETAVVFDVVPPETIRQPPLAGTPLFATPAHLLSNTILTQVYGELRTILILQDWYAVVAIIFKIVTGQNLFAQTAHTFPEILSAIKRLNSTAEGLETEVAKLSRVFWNSAEAEFRENLQRHQNLFARVQVRLPHGMVPAIFDGVARDIAQRAAAINQMVDRQTFFSTMSKVRVLKEATAERIASMRARLHQETYGAGHSSGQHFELLRFLEELEAAKRQLERLRATLAELHASQASIPADHLLHAMFQRVFGCMYLAHWPCIVPNKWAGKANVAPGIATYQATL
jgi:hypothetical protein